MEWLIDNLVFLIGIALVALLVMALLAPLDSLGWWAGWRTRKAEQHAVPPALSAYGSRPMREHHLISIKNVSAPTAAAYSARHNSDWRS